MELNIRPAAFLQNGGHGILLFGTVLEEQRSIGLYYGCRISGDSSNCVQSIRAGGECGSRFVSKLVERRIVLTHVGGIGNDQVEGLIGDRLGPVAMQETDVQQFVQLGVFLCDSERVAI